MIIFLSALAGLLGVHLHGLTAPAYFRKETLTRATATLVPDE